MIKWTIVGALLAVAFGTANGAAFMDNVIRFMHESAPYVREAGTAVQGTVRELERASGTAPGQSGPSRPQTAPLAAAALYQASTSTDIFADGVVAITVPTDQLFGITTYGHKGTAVYVSPTLALTAQHVTEGHTSRWAKIDGEVPLTIASEAPTLDVTMMTPWRPFLNQTVQAEPALPKVFHPLVYRRPAVGEQLMLLCRYAAGAPITPVTVMVTNPDSMVDEILVPGRPGRPVPAMLMTVLSGDSREGCSGAPVVDAQGNTLGLLLTGEGSSIGVASSVDIMLWLKAMRIPGY